LPSWGSVSAESTDMHTSKPTYKAKYKILKIKKNTWTNGISLIGE